MPVNRDIYKRGRLIARPGSNTLPDEFTSGLQPLKLGGQKDGYLYVPKGYDRSQPVSLAVMLHGAGGEPAHGLSYLRKYADDQNILLIAPASRAYSWDIIAEEEFDRDVIFIDQALELAFQHYAIDPERIAIGGFSDGASYALCLGLSNGDLFTHILAFSPGFQFTLEKNGKPAVFISHGKDDQVLPINPCSRRIVAQLQQEGYPISYHEFEGAHEVPTSISKRGAEWFTKKEG